LRNLVEVQIAAEIQVGVQIAAGNMVEVQIAAGNMVERFGWIDIGVSMLNIAALFAVV